MAQAVLEVYHLVTLTMNLFHYPLSVGVDGIYYPVILGIELRMLNIECLFLFSFNVLLSQSTVTWGRQLQMTIYIK